jgi:putative PIN family toxin of toxin-antitoxin system
MRIVLDSNIYISAALSVGGQPSAILKLAEESALDIFITDSIIDEIERILKEKLGWSQSTTSLWTRYI